MDAEYPKADLEQAARDCARDQAGSMEGRRLKRYLDLLVRARMYEAANAADDQFQSKKGRYQEARDVRDKLFPPSRKA